MKDYNFYLGVCSSRLDEDDASYIANLIVKSEKNDNCPMSDEELNYFFQNIKNVKLHITNRGVEIHLDRTDDCSSYIVLYTISLKRAMSIKERVWTKPSRQWLDYYWSLW